MEQYIHTAIEFQKQKLKDNYSIKRAGNEHVTKPETIDSEMDDLERVLLNLTGNNHKEHYQKLSDTAKKKDYQKGFVEGSLVRRSYSAVYFNHASDVFAIIQYTLLCKWEIVVGLWGTKWNDLPNNTIINMVQRFIPYFKLEMLEKPQGKKNVVISEKENSEYYACEDLLIPLGKLIRALAEADIMI